MIVFYHVMKVSCYHSFWAVTLRLCLRLLLWGLLFVSTSRHTIEVHSMSNLSALTCKSASRSCLRIHLGCLTALLEQSIWSPKTASRGAEEVIKVSSYIFWDSISSGNLNVWENLLLPWLALMGDQAPRKDYGTDFGCAWIQSNGIIALEIKCYHRRFVNSCGTVLIFGS